MCVCAQCVQQSLCVLLAFYLSTKITVVLCVAQATKCPNASQRELINDGASWTIISTGLFVRPSIRLSYLYECICAVCVVYAYECLYKCVYLFVCVCLRVSIHVTVCLFTKYACVSVRLSVHSINVCFLLEYDKGMMQLYLLLQIRRYIHSVRYWVQLIFQLHLCPWSRVYGKLVTITASVQSSCQEKTFHQS